MRLHESHEIPPAEKREPRPELRWPKTCRRMGYCPNCDCRTGIDRPNFLVLRFSFFAALTFLPLLFDGISTGWFLIRFGIWQKSKATCAICGGDDIWWYC